MSDEARWVDQITEVFRGWLALELTPAEVFMLGRLHEQVQAVCMRAVTEAGVRVSNALADRELEVMRIIGVLAARTPEQRLAIGFAEWEHARQGRLVREQDGLDRSVVFRFKPGTDG